MPQIISFIISSEYTIDCHLAHQVLSDNEYIIPVILDGENAWEYFHDSGVTFLNVLLSKLEQLRPNIEFITLSDALEEVGQVRELPSIPTGSWIDGTFHIWIGHPEDHAAWEMLSRARTFMESKSVAWKKAEKEEPPELQKARDYLMVAEGSDWCWWYGDDHYTPHGPEFDRLFRHNVKAAYKAMGVIPPDSIDIPIIKTDRIVQEKNVIPAPGSYIQPRVDGVVTSYFEWNSARKVVPDPGFGTMHRAGHVILSCFYYGFSVDEIFFRFDLDKVAVENVHEIELEILFQEKSVKFNSNLDPIHGGFTYSLENHRGVRRGNEPPPKTRQRTPETSAPPSARSLSWRFLSSRSIADATNDSSSS